MTGWSAVDVARVALAVAMMGVGALHFVWTRGFMKIVPPPVPARAAVLVSGVAEVALGAALLVEAARPWAAYGLVALFVAVFPANVYMARRDVPLGNKRMPRWALYARLPLQLAFIAWAWWVR